MKRVFPNQVNLAPECEADANATAGIIKSSNAQGPRRVCSSVAKIGLAISVGASSILLPGQNNSAVAADRDAPDSPATLTPSAKDKAMSPGVKSVGKSADIASVPNLPTSAHTVVSGETLWQLAQIYQIDATSIAQANGMSVGAILKVGQVLYIPLEQDVASGFELAEPVKTRTDLGEEPSQETAANFKLSKPFSQTTPEIDRTPTPSAVLSQIERKSSIPTADVDARRGLKTNRRSMASSMPSSQPIPPLSLDADKPTGLSGQTISPLGASAVHPNIRSRLNASVHRVRDGESIYKIAHQYNISVNELANLNGLSDPSFIRVGQQIEIPPGATLTPQTSLTVFGNKVTSKSSETEKNVPRISLPGDAATSTTLELATVDAATARKLDEVPNLVVSQSEKTIEEADAESSSWIALGQDRTDTDRRLAAKLKIGSPNQTRANADTQEYVEELRAGIDKLRAKHRIRPQSETVAAATTPEFRTQEYRESISSARQINPEFAPEQHTAALQTEGLQPWSQSHAEVEAAETLEEFVISAAVPEETIEESTISLDPTAAEEDSQLAVAPLGSINYDPIGAPRMVSPELPSLSAPQAYLPKVAPGTLSPGSGDFAGSFTWPAQGELSSGYGWRWGRMHQGIDIAGPVGTPIVAAASGVVSYSRWNSGGYGNLVEITHPDGSITLYAHNSRLLVNEGEEVAQGQQIAEMGSTGFSTGPHLHFELHPAGAGAVDPIAYLR